MRSNRNAQGGAGGSRDFFSTMHASQRTRPGQSSASVPGQGGQAANGAPTALVPGEPHTFGINIDRVRGRVVFSVCRCQRPASHGDAITFHLPFYGEDKNGRMMSWKEVMKRIMDMYGKDTVTRQEISAKYHEVFDREWRDFFYGMEEDWDYCARTGGDLIVHRNSTHHTEDGHQRLDLTDQGLRTQMQRPGGSGYIRPPATGPRRWYDYDDWFWDDDYPRWY